MDIEYFMKLQNAKGTQSKREKERVKVNAHMSKHFEDTFDTEDVLLNGEPFKLMIVKDTDGNTHKKKIKSPHDKRFNLGDYVIWNSQIWLIALVDTDEKTWNRGYMYLCTIPLRWQNSEGKIIERFACSENFGGNSSGVTGNSVITVGDNQYVLILPIDSETKKLKRDMRFPVDFEYEEKPDVYKLSNRKVNLNNNLYFGRGGTMTITLSYDAFDDDKDKYITSDNGLKFWVCDYTTPSTSSASSLSQPDIPNEMTDLSAVISGNTNLKIGFSRTYTVNFTDESGNQVDWNDVNFRWNVTSDFDSGLIKQSINGNTIKLSVDDEELIDFSFILSVIVNGVTLAQIKLTVSDIV